MRRRNTRFAPVLDQLQDRVSLTHFHPVPVLNAMPGPLESADRNIPYNGVEEPEQQLLELEKQQID